MQMLSFQSFDAGGPLNRRRLQVGTSEIGRPHFLSGLLLTPPVAIRVGPTPALVEASRTVHDATVLILVLEKPFARLAQSPIVEATVCPARDAASDAVGARALAERLVRWAAPVEGRLVGSFACTISRLICNLVGDAPMVRHIDESRFCRNALPLGFCFWATTRTSSARDAIVGLIADSRHPFYPVPAESDGRAELSQQTGLLQLQSTTKVLLAVAGLFDDALSLPEASQYTRAGLRKAIRAEFN